MSKIQSHVAAGINTAYFTVINSVLISLLSNLILISRDTSMSFHWMCKPCHWKFP